MDNIIFMIENYTFELLAITLLTWVVGFIIGFGLGSSHNKSCKPFSKVEK